MVTIMPGSITRVCSGRSLLEKVYSDVSINPETINGGGPRTVSFESDSCSFLPTSLLVHSSSLGLPEPPVMAVEDDSAALLVTPGTTRGMVAVGVVCSLWEKLVGTELRSQRGQSLWFIRTEALPLGVWWKRMFRNMCSSPRRNRKVFCLVSRGRCPAPPAT